MGGKGAGRRFAVVGLLLSILLPLSPLAGQGARVMGFVMDSLAGRALSGATVQLVSLADPAKARSARTGDNGFFSFDSLAAGAYALGFFHPRLDSLGIDPTMGKVTLASGDVARAPLAIPSAATLIGAWCGAQGAGDSLGVVVGSVRSAIDGAPQPKAAVFATWTEITLGDLGLRRRAPTVQVTAREDGRFVLCGVPAGSPVILRAWRGNDSTGFAEVEVPAHGILARSLLVAPALARGAAGEGGSGTVATGGPVVRGTVRTRDGVLLAGARVLLWGTGREATSGSDGAYALGGVPPGTRTIETRAIGYTPRRDAIDLMEGEAVVQDVMLERAPPVLDTIKVTRSRAETWKEAEFEGRRRSGFGTFLNDSAITQRNPIFTSDLFRNVIGVHVQMLPRRGYGVLMRGGAMSEFCVPTIYIDGVQLKSDDGNLDDLINPGEIKAVEVYPRGGTAPLVFSALNGCGSIVIWTGARGSR